MNERFPREILTSEPVKELDRGKMCRNAEISFLFFVFISVRIAAVRFTRSKTFIAISSTRTHYSNAHLLAEYVLRCPMKTMQFFGSVFVVHYDT